MSLDQKTVETPSVHRDGLIGQIVRVHSAVFGGIERALDGWFVGLVGRLVFASVLGLYFYNSAVTKLGEGFFGFLTPSTGAFGQILPPVLDAAGYDVSAIPFFPWHLIVIAGTWAEFLLPLMIVLGLFTRLAALGMIGFVVIQSYVDIVFHGLEAKFIGSMFDRFPDAIIYDQRFLWVFVLIVLVVKGAGKLSLDHLIARK